MAVFVAGTGTDVGKTLFSAFAMARYARELGLRYHKPIQTGEGSDSETVRQLTGLDTTFFLPEFVRLKLAAAPHFSAESEGRAVDAAKLVRHLESLGKSRILCELAGGLEVPIVRNTDGYYTNLDLIGQLGYGVVLVAANGLGTINHSVLSARALRQYGVNCLGIFFAGKDNPLRADNIRTICEMTQLENLGELILPESPLTAPALKGLAEKADQRGILRDIFR